MSIAQGTTHYSYPQVQLSDRPTFADFNPAFEDIDAKLYALITGASTDHSAIEALQTGLGETNLLLASVKQTADSASGKADVNAENITLLQAALGNTDRTVANKLDSVAIAEPYDAAAGTYAVGDVVVYQGQRYVCTTAVAVAEPFDADKWAGEDVETVLEHLQDEIDNISTVTAANVTIAPIAGMTATQTQEALEELKGMIPVSGGSVSVTSDGVKTYATLLNELFAQVNLSKVTFASEYVEDFGSAARAFRVDDIDSSNVRVSSAYSEAAQYEVATINISSNSTAYTGRTTTTGTTFTDRSSAVQPNGRTFTLFY